MNPGQKTEACKIQGLLAERVALVTGIRHRITTATARQLARLGFG